MLLSRLRPILIDSVPREGLVAQVVASRVRTANWERRTLGDASANSRSRGDKSGVYVPVTSVVANRLRTPDRHEKDAYQSSVIVSGSRRPLKLRHTDAEVLWGHGALLNVQAIPATAQGLCISNTFWRTNA